MKFSDVVQSADWKSEKHVPVIEAPEKVKAGEVFSVTVSVGKEVAHPNTTEHHIRWIRLAYKPEGVKTVFDTVSGTFSFANIISMIGIAIAAAALLVLGWFGLRKVISMIKSALRGKLRV